MKPCFKKMTQICIRHNKGKCVVAEEFIRTLKNEIFKDKPSNTKNMYIDKLDGIVNQ